MPGERSVRKSSVFDNGNSINNSNSQNKITPDNNNNNNNSSNTRNRAQTFVGEETRDLFKKTKVLLRFRDVEKESTYSTFHGRRMGKGFISSAGVRMLLCLILGVYEYFVFDESLCLVVNLVAVVLDFFLIGLFILTPRLFASDNMQKLLAVEVVVESCITVAALAIVDAKGDVGLQCNQYMMLGSLVIGWPFAVSNQKICLLRFPYALCSLILFFVFQQICISSILTMEGQMNTFWSAGSFIFLLLGLMNGRMSDINDRTLYVNLERIKEQKTSLAKQIATANKLTSTVFSLSDDSSFGNGKGGESSDDESSRRESNIVGEFDFLQDLDKKVKDMVTLKEIDDKLGRTITSFSSLKDVLDDSFAVRFFRYFCHVQINIENLLFYEQVRSFKNNSTNHCARIMRTFVKEGSPSEVNVDSKQRERCLAKLLNVDLFDECEVEIYKIMERDIFPRFRASSLGLGLLNCTINDDFRDFVMTGFETAHKKTS